MRIAQVSPLYERTPPKQYGGTERIVSYLTEELVKLGHDVSLYASSDSITGARLVGGCESLRQNPYWKDSVAQHYLLLEKLFHEIDRYDLVHFHVDYLHFPWTRRYRPMNLTTLHGRLDVPDYMKIFREFCEMPVASISYAQRTPLPEISWEGNVHHGIPEGLYRPVYEKSGYLAFLGRISPEKRPDRAIEIARLAGKRLKIAAKVGDADRLYFESEIQPMLDRSPNVDFIGEIGDSEKNEFLGRAEALLFPIDWPEPFGLVMIESMACGTPVIAFRCGSVQEVIEHGVTGYIVDSVPEAVEAVSNLSRLSARTCRQQFEGRFTADRMARDYVAVYERIVGERWKPWGRRLGAARSLPAVQ